MESITRYIYHMSMSIPIHTPISHYIDDCQPGPNVLIYVIPITIVIVIIIIVIVIIAGWKAITLLAVSVDNTYSMTFMYSVL